MFFKKSDDKEILAILKKIEKHLEKLAECVNKGPAGTKLSTRR